MRRVHFIGIGGYGMSGLALWAKHLGYTVTGSDMTSSTRTERLKSHGIPVYMGQRAEQVGDADTVVYTTDVPEHNPERRRAQELGIPLLHRSQLLARLLESFTTVTVSGTHGKTTTTTMIGIILKEAGWDPTVLIGGESEYFQGNFHAGQSRFAVVEADESDGSFLRFPAHIAVATNVEAEHLEHYDGDFAKLLAAFQTYLNRVPPDGLAVVSLDSPALATLLPELNVSAQSFGLSALSQVGATEIDCRPEGTGFTLVVEGQAVCRVILPVPGLHNVHNALGAMAAARHLGVDWSLSARILAQFQNANRRFQRLFHDNDILVVDDYAHHPTEIRATIKAARQVTSGRIRVLFQPQRYTRTKNLWREFLEAFDEADDVWITEIYSPPGEPPIEGIEGRRLAQEIARRLNRPVHFASDMLEVADSMDRSLTPGDTFITMGAGNVYQVSHALVERLAKRKGRIAGGS